MDVATINELCGCSQREFEMNAAISPPPSSLPTVQPRLRKKRRVATIPRRRSLRSQEEPGKIVEADSVSQAASVPAAHSTRSISPYPQSQLPLAHLSCGWRRCSKKFENSSELALHVEEHVRQSKDLSCRWADCKVCSIDVYPSLR